MRNVATLSALLTILFLAANPQAADAAVVYCKYIGVPKGCVVKPGVVLRPAPVVVAPVVTPRVGVVGVRSPVNRGGPVNRVGRR